MGTSCLLEPAGREGLHTLSHPEMGHPPSLSSSLTGLCRMALMKTSFCDEMTVMSMFCTESMSCDMNILQYGNETTTTRDSAARSYASSSCENS